MEIANAAMQLFLTRGFDATTTEQIAAAAGISTRSFFRYFETKEDVVLGYLSETGLALQQALEARPLSESPWAALRRAFDVVCEGTKRDPERALRGARMLAQTPSLRARHTEKQMQWHDALVPAIVKRLPPRAGSPQGDPRAAAIVAAALACLDAALAAWTASGGKADMGALLDDAIQAVRHP
ncbi:TetR family transcriptional regulator [Archangium violaceum]|uniref:TetR family transcriptional regulator n=1 Tax=Archangium violaceum TaxID=83451 RepID=UPI0019524803|nr:TetR family transcriptional regulator [Archangium violaceum]QRO01506.1 TetR family transcriptional regulator [Archangium violaceum]